MENRIKVADIVLLSTALILYELGIKTIVTDGYYLLIEREDTDVD